MNGPWENEQDLLKELLYWQKRALEAEKHAEEDADNMEMYVDMILMERKAFEELKEYADELEMVINMFTVERMEMKKRLYKR